MEAAFGRLHNTVAPSAPPPFVMDSIRSCACMQIYVFYVCLCACYVFLLYIFIEY